MKNPAHRSGGKVDRQPVGSKVSVLPSSCCGSVFLLSFEGKNASLDWEYNQNSVCYVTPRKLASLALMCLLAGFASANPASSVAPSPSEYLIQLWTRFQLTSQVRKGWAPFQSVFSFTFAEWKSNGGVAAIFTEVNVRRR